MMTNKALEAQNRITAILWDLAGEPEKTIREHAEKWGVSRWFIWKLKHQMIVKDGLIYRKTGKREILCGSLRIR